MFRTRLSLAFAALVALVCIQAAFVYWGSIKVYDYAQHSRLASDILSELLDLSANKQRLRVWASQRLMNAGGTNEARDRWLDGMHRNAANLKELAHRDFDLWTELAARDGGEVPPELQQLVAMTDLLDVNIAEVQSRLLRLSPLEPAADFANVWAELNDVFDKARGRDLRELVNGAIDRQRQVVPGARAATERGLNQLRLHAVGLALLTLVAAAALALHLNRRLSGPLGRLLRGTQALQSGDLGHRIALAGSRDEFDRVAEDFNAMAVELQQHRQQSEAAQRRLEEAVAARTTELSSAHLSLQRVDERRRQLFADLSHELRTPATAIRGEAEIALRGPDKPTDEYKQTLARIVGDVKQLGKVTDDLLLIARAEVDQLNMHLRPVEVPALISDAADQARAIGAVHGVAVQLELPEATPASAAPVVHADADRLRQALVIVLDNAVRYSPAGASVAIGWRNGPGDVIEIVVRDRGIGIDADELPDIFQRFVRGRRARAQRPDGTGIGLSIAQAIVTAHHGEIHVDSAPQHGTVVRIALPRSSGVAIGSRSTLEASTT